jgi:Holliday junction DNA helicase RuvA
MIGYLSGRILEHTEGKLILGMGGSDGVVGYQVNVPQSAEYGSLMPGEKVELFVYTHVREDQLELFGFTTRTEKELYLTLLSVNGIGPKGALGILSGSNTDTLIHAIMDGNKAFLTQIPGIGKKTAERVVLELADPIRKKFLSGALGNPAAPAAASSTDDARSGAAKPTGLERSTIFTDARQALVGLGFREQDVTALLNKVLSSSEKKPAHAEELVRTALKELS